MNRFVYYRSNHELIRDALVAQAKAELDENDIKTLSVFLSESATILFADDKEGAKVNSNWASNDAIAQVASYEGAKRIAAIYQLIILIEENDEKVFGEVGSDDELLVKLVTRLTAYEHVRTLVGDSIEDVILRDYFDGEIADLTIILNGVLDYGQIYISEHQRRLDKINMLLHTRKEFVAEDLQISLLQTPNAITRAANQTTISSLKSACLSVVESCLKL